MGEESVDRLGKNEVARRQEKRDRLRARYLVTTVEKKISQPQLNDTLQRIYTADMVSRKARHDRLFDTYVTNALPAAKKSDGPALATFFQTLHDRK
eukprot:NODE_8137_length_370_cov_278.087227_g6403_i0.p1 GENE.NODE_8137_length_370_cov_278.087227_g6403_i0~~NODE_8137_length_370_cov_278.087227_g6403_i0.p1  ORF type:complete len:104 (-),score=38.46 NODE_8137_length_370_cov_278.087227_g6403_i0:59-346(-)